MALWNLLENSVARVSTSSRDPTSSVVLARTADIHHRDPLNHFTGHKRTTTARSLTKRDIRRARELSIYTYIRTRSAEVMNFFFFYLICVKLRARAPGTIMNYESSLELSSVLSMLNYEQISSLRVRKYA